MINIFDVARQSGATDESGSRAEGVFCFTKEELKTFVGKLVSESVNAQKKMFCNEFFLESEILNHFDLKG